jgi:DNA-directed RNA polymerase specialized sigma24 family protein
VSSSEASKEDPFVDPMLRPYLNAEDEQNSETLLDALVEDHIAPLIRKRIRRKLFKISATMGTDHPERNVEDLCSEAHLNVIKSLRQMKADGSRKAIRNLDAYVSIVVRQVCDQQIRRLNPNRVRLESQIRYVCSHHPEFAIWEADGCFVIGRASWKSRPATDRKPDIETIQKQFLKNKGLTLKSTKQLIAICDCALNDSEGPLELEDVVRIAEVLLGVSSLRYEPLDDLERQDPAQSIDEKLHLQKYLQRIWSEVVQLPSAQRIAILLSLKDDSGRPLLPFLPLLKVANIEEIELHLSLSRDDFTKIWNNLPLSDRDIAEVLNLTTQQVANLRKCARERLSRRLKNFN